VAGRINQRLLPAALIAALFVAITIAMTFPLIRLAGSTFPGDAGDPSLNTWLLWWSTERVPLTSAWWNAPMFYPMADSMALSELLIGLLPITAPVQWFTGNPLLAYNVVFLSSFVLCGLAAYGLAKELTHRREAAVLAGLVFAFGPYRMNQLSHIQMLAYYWAPLCLLALHRFVRGREVAAAENHEEQEEHGLVWLAVFAAAWLMQALSNGYALFHLSILVGLWVIWFVRDLKTFVSIGTAWSIAALPLVAPMLMYREVHERLHLARDINEIQRFSSDVSSLASAPPALSVWGGRLLSSQFETALFPGLTVAVVLAIAAMLAFRGRHPVQTRPSLVRAAAGFVALGFLLIALSSLLLGPWSIGSAITVGGFHKPLSIAVFGAVVWIAGTGRWRRAWRERSVPAFYAAAAFVLLLLSLGPAPTFFGRQVLYEAPYAWLMRLPGFDVLRVPARFGMLLLLSEAILVALAFTRWVPPGSRRRRVLAVVVGIGVLADGWIRLPLVPAPPALDVPIQGILLGSGAKAVVELPPGEPIVDFPALYRATQHRKRLVNGFSGFAPPHYLPLVHAIGRGHERALEELALDGSLGVVVDRSLHWAGDMEALVSRLATSDELMSTERWAAFIVSGKPRPALFLGERLKISGIRVNRKTENVDRLADGDIESAWGPGVPQDGTEEVVVDLGAPQDVRTVLLAMGAFSFGFPRELSIEASRDDLQWQTVWRGETDVLTVRAALAAPEVVPLAIELNSVTARYLRLRQTGTDATVPWWIAELEIYGR
jgi:hypothetical protein